MYSIVNWQAVFFIVSLCSTKGVFMPHNNNSISSGHLNSIGESAKAKERREEELLTVPEVARLLRVDDTTVRRWIKNGVLEAITLPHQGKRQAYRVKKSTLDALLKNPASNR
jgi:excisionase family DNA binding protein